MRASIIIPTCNRADQLFQCLKSLVNLNFLSGEYEIIVVDNGSTDKTKVVVYKYIADHPEHNIKYIYDDIPGLLTGRHRGAKEAKSEILIFVDDDIHADKDWLTAIIETFDQFPDVHLVGGKCLPKYEKEPPQWLNYFWHNSPEGEKSIGWLSLCDYGNKAKEIDPFKVWGLNFSIRKASLYECGGFNPDNFPLAYQYLQGNGETGLALKISDMGYKVYYDPKALVYHEVPAERMTLDYFDKRFFFNGILLSYEQIRKNGLNQQSSIIKGSWKFGKKTLKSIKHFIFKNSNKSELSQKNSEFEKDMLVTRFQVMEKAGFAFHQEMAKKNPFIMQWVLRDNYFDYNLPNINQ
jgi:glucosyl-dolichyl phosphate glucuronosyltransferase